MVEAVKTENFESFLVQNGFVTRALYEKLKEQGEKTGNSVISLITEQKILDSETLAKAKAAFLNIPYVSFEDKEVPREIIELIPEETYTFYKLFAFERN